MPLPGLSRRRTHSRGYPTGKTVGASRTLKRIPGPRTGQQTPDLDSLSPKRRISLHDLRMGICVGISPQTRSLRSSGSIHSRSTSELLPDGKRPSFLVSRRFALDTPTPCPRDLSWCVLNRKSFARVAPSSIFGTHLRENKHLGGQFACLSPAQRGGRVCEIECNSSR